ncbi:MAG: glycosyltransferase family 4 protein [Halobacteriota archaeon]
MTQERCRLLFATSFDVRLVDSVNTDGSAIRLLEDSLLPYERMCDLFLFTGDTHRFELAPAIEHVPAALFHRFGLWHLSYTVISAFKIAKRLKGKSLVKGFSAACPGAVLAAKLKKKPCVVFYEYNWAYQVTNVNKGRALGTLASFIEGYVIKNADAVVTRNASLKNELQLRGAGRIVVIPLTFDEDVFRPGIDFTDLKEKYGIRDEKILMFVGRLHPVKRLDLLLTAVQQLDEKYRLFIVGTGAIENELKEMAKSLGVSNRVIFTGAVPYSEVPKFMNMADLLVMTSSIEGQPRVLIEAMSCGTPAVGTNVFGIRDTIEEGVTGHLASDDPSDIAEKISQALENEEFPHLCRSVALKNYSNKMCIAKEKALFEELLSRH